MVTCQAGSAREAWKLSEPGGPAAVLVPQHGEERLVERQVAPAPVARVDDVRVLRMEAGLHRDEVGDERAALDVGLVRARPVEGQREVEGAAAGLHYHR